jgi:integrase
VGPRLRLPPYVHSFTDRYGTPRYYFRRRGFPQAPLPGIPYSAEWMSAYEQASAAAPAVIGSSRTVTGTVHHAVALYLDSEAFKSLAPITQGMRRRELERFRRDHGDRRIAMMRPEDAARILNRLRPYPQRNALKALRGLMAFAVRERLVDSDPTAGFKPTKVKNTGGFTVWTEADIEMFEDRHPIGSRARLALGLLLYTGQRRGDVVLMGRQHIRDGTLSLRQSKTGAQVDIPVLPELQAIFDASTLGNLTFVMTERGKPFTPASFGNWFRRMCDGAGLAKGLSAHGLRKAAATRLADHGATAHELMSWFGWSSISEAERYTRAANRKVLAQGVIKKLEKGTGSGKL